MVVKTKNKNGAKKALSLGKSVGIAVGAIGAMVLIACCCFAAMKKRRKHWDGSNPDSRHKGDELLSQPNTLLYSPPPEPPAEPGSGDDVDITFGVPPPRPEDSFVFPDYVQVFYPSEYPELRASADTGTLEPTEAHSPIHLAIALDTSRSGASMLPTRKAWAASLTPILRSLAARCRGRLSVALVSFSGDTATEIPVDVSDATDRTTAFGRAIETISPPRGEGMRNKARASGHVSAVDEAWDAIMRMPQGGAARRRVLLLTASGDISGGETFNIRARERAGIWQPPPGVVVAAVTAEARPEMLVQLGSVGVKVDDVAVLGTSAGANSVLNLLLRSTSPDY